VFIVPMLEKILLATADKNVLVYNLNNPTAPFKCHRIKTSVYAVNDIAFHPLGTFATCGSDGTFHFWDKDSKQRLKQFKKCSLPISCCHFNAEGNIFAYAVCYDWYQGSSGYDPNVMKNHILLQQVGRVKRQNTKVLLIAHSSTSPSSSSSRSWCRWKTLQRQQKP